MFSAQSVYFHLFWVELEHHVFMLNWHLFHLSSLLNLEIPIEVRCVSCTAHVEGCGSFAITFSFPHHPRRIKATKSGTWIWSFPQPQTLRKNCKQNTKRIKFPYYAGSTESKLHFFIFCFLEWNCLLEFGLDSPLLPRSSHSCRDLFISSASILPICSFNLLSSAALNCCPWESICCCIWPTRESICCWWDTICCIWVSNLEISFIGNRWFHWCNLAPCSELLPWSSSLVLLQPQRFVQWSTKVFWQLASVHLVVGLYFCHGSNFL